MTPANREELVSVIAQGVRPIKPAGVGKMAQSYGVAVDILSAIEAAGCSVVPNEANTKMMLAGAGLVHELPPQHSQHIRARNAAARSYRAMLTESPFRRGN